MSAWLGQGATQLDLDAIDLDQEEDECCEQEPPDRRRERLDRWAAHFERTRIFDMGEFLDACEVEPGSGDRK